MFLTLLSVVILDSFEETRLAEAMTGPLDAAPAPPRPHSGSRLSYG